MARWHAPALIAALLTAVLVSVGVGVSLRPDDGDRACAAMLNELVADGTSVGPTACSSDDGFGWFAYAPIGGATPPAVDSEPAGPRVKGVVRFFHDEEGWGVIDSPATPGGAWILFASIDAEGYRQLDAGQHVTFVVDPHGQDGYDYRAESVRVTRP